MNNGLRHVRKKQISLKYSQSRFCRKHVILIILNWTLIVLFLCSSKLKSSRYQPEVKTFFEYQEIPFEHQFDQNFKIQF